MMSARTYGNWSLPRSPGLFGLGTTGTVVLFAGGVVIAIVMAQRQIIAAAVIALVLAVLLMMTARRDRHGRTMARNVVTGLSWGRAVSGRRHLYRSGPLGRTPGGNMQLPGLAAASTLTEWQDGYGVSFAMLEARAAGTFTVVFSTQPDGSSLVDAEQIDTWVARWSGWLGGLANQPTLEGASVTIETSPDTGLTLERELTENTSPDAPPFARAVVDEMRELYPLSGAQVRGFVALTFRATTNGRRRNAEDMARALAPQMAGLQASLSETGAGAVRPVSAAELCGIVRSAYDPAVAPHIDRYRQSQQWPEELTWNTAGPVAHQTAWSTYRHDSGLSMSWVMTQAPRSMVTAGALTQLLSPTPVIARKRVTIMYRPLDPAAAADAIHADINAASFNATQRSNPQASKVLAVTRAAASAREEAEGAAVIDFGMVVTATVTEAQARAARAQGDGGFEWLEAEAESEVMRASQHAKVLLRRAYGSQDVAFAVALPLGQVLSRHMALPGFMKEML